jgi:hypothetical protein
MRHFLALAFAALPVFAGALTLQLDDVKTDPEASAQNAAVVAHITACHSAEKTTVTAFAEGMANGKRQTISLKVIPLSQPGSFAVTHQWPHDGIWAVKMIATNPEYKNYSTAVVVPFHDDRTDRASAKVFYHAPSAEEVDSVLKQTALE